MEYMSSLQNEFDAQKPSLFELLSEAQLSSLLPPSLRYLLAIATHRHPRYLLRILNSFDELYALLSLLIEHHYLRTQSASFTETFYSLKRERVLRIKGGEVPRAALGSPAVVRETLKLRRREIWLNLVGIVGLPYLKRKLDEGFDIHAAPQAALLRSGGAGPRFTDDEDGLAAQRGLKKKILYCYKWFLRNVYPSVNAGWYFALLAFQLAYLFDNTKYSSPFLWLVGTRMRRMNGADFAAVQKAEEDRATRAIARAAASGRGGLLESLRPGNVAPRVLDSLRFVLPTSIFALKFLEWWHASDFAAQLGKKATEGLELPPPIISGGKRITSTTLSKSSSTSSLKNHDNESLSESNPSKDPTSKKSKQHPKPPISSTSYLPIYTVSPPYQDAPSNPSELDQENEEDQEQTRSHPSTLCPICLNPLTTPTATQTGHIYCYACIVRWIRGEHERQEAFMRGEGGVWEDRYTTDDEGNENKDNQENRGEKEGEGESRVGRWESGMGRDPVTGRRLLGGTDGLRRVMV